MTLLKLEDIRQKLDEEFAPLEPELTGFRMRKSRLEMRDIKRIACNFGIEFPDSFVELLSFCDLGDLTLGQISFGSGHDYESTLKKYNISPECRWWSGDATPNSMLVVALSDPYTIVLNCESGEVIGFPNDQTIECGVVIASDIVLFVRGVGTIFLTRNDSDDKEDLGYKVSLAARSDNSEFWIQLAR